MEENSIIYVAGHRGLVGSAVCRVFENNHSISLVGFDRDDYDLRRQTEVELLFHRYKPTYVFLCAAKVGGIMANKTLPADFIYQNLAIQTNVIQAAYQTGVKKLMMLGSSCIYPRECPQPIREEYLLTGPLEPTNEPYAVAKIAGLKMIQAYRRQYGVDFISVMPTNLFGSGDNFDLNTSHVLPAMIRKFHDAKINGFSVVELWGTGKPRREFLHVDDLADACVFLMQNYSDDLPINIGCGQDVSIAELAEIIRSIVGFKGDIRWDTSKPDGTPRKLLDISRIKALGWNPKIDLVSGIRMTYEAFKKGLASV